MCAREEDSLFDGRKRIVRVKGDIVTMKISHNVIIAMRKEQVFIGKNKLVRVDETRVILCSLRELLKMQTKSQFG